MVPTWQKRPGIPISAKDMGGYESRPAGVFGPGLLGPVGWQSCIWTVTEQAIRTFVADMGAPMVDAPSSDFTLKHFYHAH